MATGMHMDERSVDCLVLGHYDQDRKVSAKSVTMRAMTLCKNLSGYRELLLSCQLYIILTTGCQNLGRLNRKLSEVLTEKKARRGLWDNSELRLDLKFRPMFCSRYDVKFKNTCLNMLEGNLHVCLLMLVRKYRLETPFEGDNVTA